MKAEGMRAVVIASHGGVEALEVREVSRPAEACADRVLVRVRAAGLNLTDRLPVLKNLLMRQAMG